jgi:structural maintenance of chromosome 1
MEIASVLTFCIEKDGLVLHRTLYKLFHIEQSIKPNAGEIKTQNETLAPLREDQRVHDNALQDTKTEQARARSVVMQKEKMVKNAEKTLDAKVISLLRNMSNSPRLLNLFDN